MSPSWSKRSQIAEDTLRRTEQILHQYPGGSIGSTFIASQLLPLDKSSYPNNSRSTISVLNSDSFTVARDIIRRDNNAKGKTTVLNLASDEIRAGGWVHSLSKTQEEALCYSSTLYVTLREEYYPWPNMGPGSIAGIYSPAVVIFKDDLDHDCVDLPPSEVQVVSVITVAAPRSPPLTSDGGAFRYPRDLDYMREKIRLVYRIAAHNGQQYLVLAAMGCGAYECPPQQVANEMKAILLEDEFKGWFREVIFAVYSTSYNRNYEVFKDVFEDVQINA